MFQASILLALAISSTSCFAAVKPGELPYYGADFYNTRPSGPKLREKLFKIMSETHSQMAADYDRIGGKCESARSCYRHTVISYNRAREFLFGDFYLVSQNKEFGVKDVYCDRVAFSHEFPGLKPGPNQVPDAKIMNTEHSWPQSRFSRSFPQEVQKSDLHHLFPTDSEINSKRSSFDFGEVMVDESALKCRESRLGAPRSKSETVFEPPQAHKGNVARAIFYFSVRYKMPIRAEQEAALKDWNRADPVDEEERVRNERIFGLQKIRNPFVDHPELADRVSDF